MNATLWADRMRRVTGATSRRGALRTLTSGAVLTAFGPAVARAQEATPVANAGDWTLVETLARDAEGTTGVIGVAVHGAARELFARHGDRRFRAASTIKVPIMIEAYRQIERGALSPDDRHVLRDEDRVPGSGVLGHLHAGLVLTLADLLSLMFAGRSPASWTNIRATPSTRRSC